MEVWWASLRRQSVEATLKLAAGLRAHQAARSMPCAPPHAHSRAPMHTLPRLHAHPACTPAHLCTLNTKTCTQMQPQQWHKCNVRLMGDLFIYLINKPIMLPQAGLMSPPKISKTAKLLLKGGVTQGGHQGMAMAHKWNASTNTCAP